MRSENSCLFFERVIRSNAEIIEYFNKTQKTCANKQTSCSSHRHWKFEINNFQNFLATTTDRRRNHISDSPTRSSLPRITFRLYRSVGNVAKPIRTFEIACELPKILEIKGKYSNSIFLFRKMQKHSTELTCHERRGQRWCPLQCTTANNHKRRLSFHSTTAQLPQTIPRNYRWGTWVRQCHNASQSVCSASNGSCNYKIAIVCPCDTAPNTHCSCSNCERSKYFRRCSGNCVAWRQRRELTGRFQCSWAKLGDWKECEKSMQ